MSKKKMKKTEKKQNNDKNKNLPSLRAFEMVQQIEYLGENWEENLQNRLKQHEKKFSGWIYILHDKDTIVVDGVEKKKDVHVHLYAKCTDAYKVVTLANIFGVEPQYIESIHSKYYYRGKLCADMGMAYRYATHRGFPDKAQYDDNLVVGKEGYNWKDVRAKSEERVRKSISNEYINSIVARIVAGEIKRFNIHNFVSAQAYVIHKAKLEKAFEYADIVARQNHNRDTVVWYIYGKSGTGKTTTAKYIAEEENMSYMIAGSDTDPFQDYKGQDAIILDDMKGDLKFTLAEFLRIIDNNTSSSVRSRYNDKFLNVKAIFITSTMSQEIFFKQFEKNYNEEFYQLQRRCKMKIELTENKLKMYTFRKDSRKYEFIGEEENPVTKQYRAEEVDISDEDLNRYCSIFGISYDPNKPKAETTQENSPTPAVQTAGIKRKDDTDNGRGKENTEESNGYDLPF